jgi:hypothetical protein
MGAWREGGHRQQEARTVAVGSLRLHLQLVQGSLWWVRRDHTVWICIGAEVRHRGGGVDASAEEAAVGCPRVVADRGEKGRGGGG